MSGWIPVVIGFVVLGLLTVGVIAYIVRSAIREVQTRDARVKPAVDDTPSPSPPAE